MDSRGGPNNSVRRRRACCNSQCLHRMTTYELVVDNAPMVDVEQLAKKITETLGEAITLIEQAGGIVAAAATLSKIDRAK